MKDGITFYYGAMKVGKSLELLRLQHQRDEAQLGTVVFVPATVVQGDHPVVCSRLMSGALKTSAIALHDDVNIIDVVEELNVVNKSDGAASEVRCILIDEAQFLSPKHLDELEQLADEPPTIFGTRYSIVCFGLRTDAFGKVFEGAERLLARADHLIEVPGVCSQPRCENVARMSARITDKGTFLCIGEDAPVIDIAAEYVPLCRMHHRKNVGYASCPRIGDGPSKRQKSQ